MWRSRAVRPRRWLLRMLLLTAVLAIGLGWSLMVVISLSTIEHVEARVDDVGDWASLVRLSLIAGIAALWRPIVLHLHAGNRLPERPVRDWLALRWRVVFWLLLLELFIGQNLLGGWLALLLETTA